MTGRMGETAVRTSVCDVARFFVLFLVLTRRFSALHTHARHTRSIPSGCSKPFAVRAPRVLETTPRSSPLALFGRPRARRARRALARGKKRIDTPKGFFSPRIRKAQKRWVRSFVFFGSPLRFASPRVSRRDPLAPLLLSRLRALHPRRPDALAVLRRPRAFQHAQHLAGARESHLGPRPERRALSRHARHLAERRRADEPARARLRRGRKRARRGGQIL